MPSATQIATNVLINRLGLNDPGGSVSSSDTQLVYTVMNEMLQQWSIDRPMIYTIAANQYPLSSGIASYTYGPGGTWSTTVGVNRIENAVFVSTVGTATSRKPLQIVPAAVYYAHGDTSASATTSDEIYPDYNYTSSQMTVRLFPVPSCPTTSYVELQTWQPLPQFPDLTTNVVLRDGYQECIEWNVAFKLLPTFGVTIRPETAQIVALEAANTQKRIRALNAANGFLAPENSNVAAAQMASQPPQEG